MSCYNNKADLARKMEASHADDLADMGQGKLSKSECPKYATDTMDQGKLGNFQGGNLGTFMGQTSSGGKV